MEINREKHKTENKRGAVAKADLLSQQCRGCEGAGGRDSIIINPCFLAPPTPQPTRGGGGAWGRAWKEDKGKREEASEDKRVGDEVCSADWSKCDTNKLYAFLSYYLRSQSPLLLYSCLHHFPYLSIVWEELTFARRKEQCLVQLHILTIFKVVICCCLLSWRILRALSSAVFDVLMLCLFGAWL